MRGKEHKLLTRGKENQGSWKGAQVGCGVFILQSIQHLPGQCPEQPEVTLLVTLLKAEHAVTGQRGMASSCKRVGFEIRKKFLTVRLMKYWNRLLREAVGAPSLKHFKARLGGALNNMT